MRCRNYRQEIGVASTERPVSPGIAFGVMAVVAVAALFFFREVVNFKPAPQETAGEPAPLKQPLKISSR